MIGWRQGIALGAREVLAYRTELLARCVSAALVGVLTTSVWLAVTRGRTEVGGVPASALVTYVLVAWLWAAAVSTRVDQHLADRAASGALALDLLRPGSLQAQAYFRDLGRTAATAVFTTVPLLAGALVVVPVPVPTAPSAWLAFAASLPVSHALAFALAWLVGLGAVLLRTGTGLLHLKGAVLALLSGALIPLEIYPDAVRHVVVWLPFAGLSHTPAALLTGRGGLDLLAVQAGWAVLLLGLGHRAWRSVSRHLVLQGG